MLQRKSAAQQPKSAVLEEPAVVAAPAAGRGLTEQGVLRLQRAAGNAAVARALASPPRAERPGLVTEAHAAAALQEERTRRRPDPGSIRFRLPSAADVKASLVKAPEASVKAAIEKALARMKIDGKLKTADPVADIMKKVFPAPGKFDEVEYAKVTDLKDPKNIYGNVADAEAKIRPADKAKLTAAMKDARDLVDKAVGDAKNLKLVFGSKDSNATTIYGKAKTALKNLETNLGTAVDTDYNLDDAEVGLGGWASFSTQHVHLERDVAEVKDHDDAVFTLIHEAAHLADGSVDDKGYYGTPGFEAMTEDEKITNAAHFEEVPKRILKKSAFGNVEFKPGAKKGGAKMTPQDEVKREASEFLRKAWDKSVDVHQFFRNTKMELDAGNKAGFTASNARIMDVSKLMKLTIHDQPAATATVTMTDIVSTEGVAHATIAIQRAARKVVVPDPLTKPKADHVKDVVDDAIKAYGALTGSFSDDRKLVDWLVANYRKYPL